MTLKEIKDYIKGATLIAQEKLSDEEIKDFRNMAYYLVKNYYFSKSIRNITTSDLDLLLDNLVVNNEIITIDNIYDYSVIDLGYYYYNQVIDRDKKLLLNFYNINGDLKNCKIAFTKNYNAL